MTWILIIIIIIIPISIAPWCPRISSLTEPSHCSYCHIASPHHCRSDWLARPAQHQLIVLAVIWHWRLNWTLPSVDKCTACTDASHIQLAFLSVAAVNEFIHMGARWGGQMVSRGPKCRGGVGFLGGLHAPLHLLGGLGSAVSSPSGVRGADPAQIDFCTIFDL